MANYGTTLEQIGKIAIAQRFNAIHNPQALFREPMSMQDYLNSRMISDPIRLFDCVMPCSGAECILLASEEKAKQITDKLVYLVTDAEISHYQVANMLPDKTTFGQKVVGERIFSELKREDIDLFEIYDDYPIAVMRLKVDIIVVAGGIGPIRAAKNATKTIPIIMVGVGNDPVEAGLVESLARPGNNVTGITNLSTELGGKRLELFKEAVPKLARVAVLYAATPSSVHEVKDVLPVAALGLTVQSWEVRDANGFDRVFAALNKQRPDGLYVSGSPLMRANQKRIAAFALKSRLPSMYSTREAVDAGGLMSYAADDAYGYRRVAYYVDRILKGAKPADLPVEQPTKFEFIINLKTAKQIDVTIPPDVLARASKLIK